MLLGGFSAWICCYLTTKISDMSRPQSDSSTRIRPKVRPYKKPNKWRVILHNDDVTTMDFVVRLLKEVFGKSTEDAMTIMLKVHEEGSGTAGIYSKDLAETKMLKSREMARAEGFPLKITIEENE